MNILLLLMLLLGVSAQQPAPSPTIDQLIDKVLDLRKQKAELDKQEAAALADLQKLMKELQDRFDKLKLPPGPKPPDPVVPDALGEVLKAAYKRDSEAKAGTKSNLADLASLWKMAGKMVLSKNSDTYEVNSSADLMAAIRKAAASMDLPLTVFPKLRKEIGDQVLSALGEESDTPYTEAQREATAALLTKIGGILNGLPQ